MLKDTKSLGNNKAPACESRGFVRKKEGVLFNTPSNFILFLEYPYVSPKHFYRTAIFHYIRILAIIAEFVYSCCNASQSISGSLPVGLQ